jgi:ABC-type spermidine/putrescine transport system permease subunit II
MTAIVSYHRFLAQSDTSHLTPRLFLFCVVVRSRMMDYRSEVGTAASQGAKLWPTIHRIYQHEGVSGFYSGLHISLLRVIPNCCITFLTYELLLRWSREQLERRQRRP